MNRTYKVIWNASRQVWVAVGELTAARGKSKSQANAPASNKADVALGAALLTAGLSLMASPVLADTWSNTGTGDWATDANWADSSAPTSSDDARIGNGGTAQVTSAVSNKSSTVDFGSTVTVDGSGSSWSNSEELYVGRGGTGTLSISNGGAVSNTYGYLGAASGSTGTVTVDGSGSSWTNNYNNSLYVGLYGTASLTISNDGEVNVGGSEVYIAEGNGSTGTINIGAEFGETAVAAGTLNVGIVQFGGDSGGGTGKLVFNHTDTDYVFSPDISGAGSVDVYSGTTIFTGSNTYTGGTTINAGTLQIGNGGTSGSISGDITNNGTLAFNRSDDISYTGAISGSGGLSKLGSNTLTLTGANTYTGGTTINAGTLQIGNGGTSGSIVGDITNNGTLAFNRSDDISYTGAISGSGSLSKLGSNTLTLTGANSYTGSTTVDVGALQINNGGSVSNDTGYIGLAGGSTGAVTVDGNGSSWTNSGTLYVGLNGTGTLNISNGGTVSAGSSTVGLGSGSSGTVTVDGSDSAWNNSNSLTVGSQDTGSLTISNGGVVTNSSGIVGHISGSSAVTVDGSGSNWTNSGDLSVGYLATGMLTIRNGASVNSDTGYIARVTSGSSGTVAVEGSGSSWTTNNDLYVGSQGAGTLTIGNGGEVNVHAGSGTALIANITGSSGTLNIGAAAGDTAVAAGTLSAGTVQLGDDSGGGGTGKLVFNHTDTDYVFAPDIVSAGSDGTYTIELYSGVTRFGGNLSSFSGTMTNDGGTLSVAAGDTLTLGGDYTQTADGTLKVGVDDNTTYGKLIVTGTATLVSNAKIDVNVSDPSFNFTATEMQDIISAGTLTSDGTFVVTDNSTLFNFSAVKDGNTVDLALAAASSGGGVLESVVGTGNTPATGAAQVLDDLVEDFAGGSTGNADMDLVIAELGKLSTQQQVSDAAGETLPLLVSGTTQVAIGTLHATSRVIQARQEGFSGISSGDDFLTDKHLWFKPVGSWTKQDERDGVAGYTADSYGFVGGIDGNLNDITKLGFAFSYMNSDIEGRNSASGNKADIDAYQAIFYGSHSLKNHPDIELNWQADVGINKTEGTRHISFINRTAKADYDSYTAHIGVGAGKRFELNNTTTFIPSIRADYAYIKDESYTEKEAGALNLDVDDNHSDELIVMAQGNISHTINDTASFIANAGIGYDLLNDSTSLTASYIGGGTAFTTEGIDPSPWLARAGVGMNFQTGDTSEITARYDVEGRESFLNQTASVKFRWMF